MRSDMTCEATGPIWVPIVPALDPVRSGPSRSRHRVGPPMQPAISERTWYRRIDARLARTAPSGRGSTCHGTAATPDADRPSLLDARRRAGRGIVAAARRPGAWLWRRARSNRRRRLRRDFLIIDVRVDPASRRLGVARARSRPVRAGPGARRGSRRARLRRAALHLPGDRRRARAGKPSASAATSLGGRPTSSPPDPIWAPIVTDARHGSAPRSPLRQEALQGGAGGAGDVEAAGGEDGVVAVGAVHGQGAGGARRRRRRAPRRSRGRRRRGRRPRRGCPAGDGAVQATTTSNSSARSASSIAVGSRSVPTTRMRRPSGWKSSKKTSAHVSAPAGLWAPSTITSGWWPSTSKRPGIVTAANPSVTTSSASGAAKNASTAVRAIDGVVALVGAVQRHEHVGVDRRRRADVDQPAADGERVAGRLEVGAAQQPGRRRRLGEHGDDGRVGLADHRRRRPA